MRPILIGVHGVKRSGKGTVFHMAAEWGRSLGMSAKERGFADYGKLSFARQFFPAIQLEEAVTWCDAFKVSGKMHVEDPTQWPVTLTFEGREPIAHLLTEGGRDLHGEDVWVDKLLPLDPMEGPLDIPQWYEEFYVDPFDVDLPRREIPSTTVAQVADICGVTDLRFMNEAERIKRLRGYLWKVRRQEAEDAVIEEARSKGREVHRSELGLPDSMFDVIFDNNSDFDHLREQVWHTLTWRTRE